MAIGHALAARGLRPGGGADRAGDSGSAPGSAGDDGPRLAGAAARRADPRPARARRLLRRCHADQRRPRRRRGAAARRRAVARRKPRPGCAPDQMVVVDEQAFRRLPALIAVYRAAIALVRGDVAATMAYAQRSLDAGRRRRPSRARSGRRLARARILGERRPRGRATARTPIAWPACGKRATSPTPSVARSPWPTSGSPRAVRVTRCVPTSRPCSWHRHRPARCCAGRPTCTWE